MCGIPLTAGSEASGGWPPHRGPRPAFKPGPADVKAAKKAEKEAERERRRQEMGQSSNESGVKMFKTRVVGKVRGSDPDTPKRHRAERNRDGIPIN
ncbi:hypothetical protein LX36DRAFT_657255 [Colletotrichum falcatum]|nr:hypothetical protein LX36DRAFT_657255 [Colletotrichum falcatum]